MDVGSKETRKRRWRRESDTFLRVSWQRLLGEPPLLWRWPCGRRRGWKRLFRCSRKATPIEVALMKRRESSTIRGHRPQRGSSHDGLGDGVGDAVVGGVDADVGWNDSGNHWEVNRPSLSDEKAAAAGGNCSKNDRRRRHQDAAENEYENCQIQAVVVAKDAAADDDRDSDAVSTEVQGSPARP